MTIAEFLMARVAEDEAAAWADQRDLECEFGKGGSQLSSALANVGTGYMDYPAIAIDNTRVLAECAAKRAIIEASRGYSPELSHGDNGEWAFNLTLRTLATVYADHPDYRDEWRLDG